MPDFFPAGSIVAFAGPLNKIPQGWLPCDGKLYDRTRKENKALFDAIGTNWGGDGSDKFAVPDLRGQFLRGVADAATTDPEKDSRAHSRTDLTDSGSKGNDVGSKQGCEVQSHTHHYNAAILIAEGGDGFWGAGFESNSGAGGKTYTIAAAGGTETRPINAYVHYIVKL